MEAFRERDESFGMSFVPLAPIYAYVAGVDNAKAYRVTSDQLDEMCRLLAEGMEVGGCGFSAQVSGEVGNVQLDYDGTPMVTDCMTEQEVVAFECVEFAQTGRIADHCRRIFDDPLRVVGPVERAEEE